MGLVNTVLSLVRFHPTFLPLAAGKIKRKGAFATTDSGAMTWLFLGAALPSLFLYLPYRMSKASSVLPYQLIRCCRARSPNLAAGSRTPGDRADLEPLVLSLPKPVLARGHTGAPEHVFLQPPP